MENALGCVQTDCFYFVKLYLWELKQSSKYLGTYVKKKHNTFFVLFAEMAGSASRIKNIFVKRF